MTTVFEDMSARTIDPALKEAADQVPDFIISADSHVDEPSDLWKDLPKEIREELPEPPTYAPDKRPAGGLDPKARIKDMDLDGLAAEILYPTATLRVFHRSQAAQEAAFRVYNDWIAEYCKTAPDRLFAVPCLCAYDIDQAVAEMQRCHDMGMLGGLIWQVPDPDLPFTSDHYEKLWAAAVELGYPINLHILTGFNYFRDPNRRGMEKLRGSVNTKTADIVTTLFDLIFSGVFERHPKLKAEIVEGEIGWTPFVLQQWDYYFKRNTNGGKDLEDFNISRLPSEIFEEHVYATFMDDYVGAQALKYWGDHNCMWSSDYPHPNMTWPNSRAFLAKQIGDLEPARQKRVLSENVIELYGLKV